MAASGKLACDICFCNICPGNLEQHVAGKKHRRRLAEAQAAPAAPTATTAPTERRATLSKPPTAPAPVKQVYRAKRVINRPIPPWLDAFDKSGCFHTLVSDMYDDHLFALDQLEYLCELFPDRMLSLDNVKIINSMEDFICIIKLHYDALVSDNDYWEESKITRTIKLVILSLIREHIPLSESVQQDALTLDEKSFLSLTCKVFKTAPIAVMPVMFATQFEKDVKKWKEYEETKQMLDDPKQFEQLQSRIIKNYEDNIEFQVSTFVEAKQEFESILKRWT